MVIAIWILSAIIVALLFVGYELIHYIKVYLYQQVLNVSIEERVEDIFPCNLTVQCIYNAKEDLQIADFSKYEEYGIIGLEIYMIESLDCFSDLGLTPAEVAQTARPLILTDVYLCKTKGGEYYWLQRS